MKLGIFTQYIEAPTIEALAEKVASYGLSCVVLDTYPGLDIDLSNPSANECQRIRRAFEEAGVDIAAVGGYLNLVHPDRSQREAIYGQMYGMIALCEQIGAPMLCSEIGSYHPNGYDWEPSNMTDQALECAQTYIKPLLEEAKRHGITIALEAYVMSVAYTTQRMRRFIEHVDDDHVRVVYDPAGILTRATLDEQELVLPDTFSQIEPYIGLIHVQDVTPAASVSDHFQWQCAGTGQVNYPLFMDLVVRSGYTGPLILEFLAEEQIPEAKHFVTDQWAQAQQRK